jgi:uncharacterized membrane protein
VIVTGLIGYLVTGSLEIAGQIAAIDSIIKFFLFYFHDRVWKMFK